MLLHLKTRIFIGFNVRFSASTEIAVALYVFLVSLHPRWPTCLPTYTKFNAGLVPTLLFLVRFYALVDPHAPQRVFLLPFSLLYYENGRSHHCAPAFLLRLSSDLILYCTSYGPVLPARPVPVFYLPSCIYCLINVSVLARLNLSFLVTV